MLRSREGNWHYRFKYKGREYTGNTGLVANERERRGARRDGDLIQGKRRRRINWLYI